MIPKLSLPLSAIVAVIAAVPALSLETTPFQSSNLSQTTPETQALAQQNVETSLLKPETELPKAQMLAQATGSDQFGNSFSPAQDQELLNDLTPFVSTSKPRPRPGMTFGTPTAYGAAWRQAFIGTSGTIDLPGGRLGRPVDGSFSFGAGLGDPVNSVGVEIPITVTSVTPKAGDFGNSGSIGFEVHKIIPGTEGLAVAFGWDNPITWGDVNKAKKTFYGVASKTFLLRPGTSNTLPFSVSLGMGTGTFRSTGAYAANKNAPNLFGSLGVILIPQVSLATSWTGSGLNLGMGLAPFEVPLTFSFGVTDLTDNSLYGRGFNINAGYAINF